METTETPDITANQFAGGTKTSGDPYEVANPGQLDNVRNNLNATFMQTKDIDFAGSCKLTASYDATTQQITFTQENPEAPFFNNGSG